MDGEYVHFITDTDDAEDSTLASPSGHPFLFLQIDRYQVHRQIEYFANVITTYGKIIHSAGPYPSEDLAAAKAAQWATLHQPTALLFPPGLLRTVHATIDPH